MDDTFDDAEVAPAFDPADVEPLMHDGRFTIAALLRFTFWVAVWVGALRLFWIHYEVIDRWFSVVTGGLLIAVILVSIAWIIWFCPWERKNSPRL